MFGVFLYIFDDFFKWMFNGNGYEVKVGLNGNG